MENPLEGVEFNDLINTNLALTEKIEEPKEEPKKVESNLKDEKPKFVEEIKYEFGDPEEQEEDGNDVEEEEEVESPEVYPILNLLHQELGWEDIDKIPEENRPKNSISGMVEYLNNVVNLTVNNQLQSISELENGKVGEMIEYVRNGGKIEEFLSNGGATNYSDINVEEADEETQKRVVAAKLRKEGYDESDIQESIKEYEDTGILLSESKRALKKLASLEAKDAEIKKRQEEDRRKSQAEEKEMVQNSVKQAIHASKTIAGIPVSTKDREEFFNFLYKENKNGDTQYSHILKKDPSAAVKMAYLLYKGFNYAEAGKTDQRKETTNKVKELLSTQKQVSKSNKSARSDDGENEVLSGKISFNNLLLD